jgi:urate oxidase
LFDGEQAVKDNMFSNDFTLSASDDGSSVIVLTDMATPIASVLVKVNEESLPVSFLRYFYLHLALKTAKMSGSSDIVKERIFNEIQLVENEARILFASLSNNKIYDDENYYVDVRS